MSEKSVKAPIPKKSNSDVLSVFTDDSDSDRPIVSQSIYISVHVQEFWGLADCLLINLVVGRSYHYYDSNPLWILHYSLIMSMPEAVLAICNKMEEETNCQFKVLTHRTPAWGGKKLRETSAVNYAIQLEIANLQTLDCQVSERELKRCHPRLKHVIQCIYYKLLEGDSDELVTV